MTKRLYVPDHVIKERQAANEAQTQKKKDLLNPATFALSDEVDEDRPALERLPRPTGWRVLILPYTLPESTKGGILLSDETRSREQLATNIGYVVSLGPDAYADTGKFPDGAWCKEGDWVMFGRYAGSRFKIDGAEPRLLNDDEILAVIDDPRDILAV
jgi:chaperonin GroES|tara:strand:+ start:23013 stop:23486 length:474 start_codon:yes stop_codon:yes gene_type:complete